MGTYATFDAPTKTITIIKPSVGGAVSINAQSDIYSAAKADWISDNTLNKFRFPFSTIGGDDLGGGVFAGAYYFLDNISGWTILPLEEDHRLTIVGNLFGLDPAQPIVSPTAGAFTVIVQFERSSLTQAIVTGGGGGATAGEIADAVWDEDMAVHVAAGSAGAYLGNVNTKVDALYTLFTVARGEPGSGAPPVSATSEVKLDWIYKHMRNKKDADGTFNRYYDSTGAVVQQKQSTNEAAGVVTVGDIVSGP